MVGDTFTVATAHKACNKNSSDAQPVTKKTSAVVAMQSTGSTDVMASQLSPYSIQISTDYLQVVIIRKPHSVEPQ